MSDAQLLAGYSRLEKILRETEVYNKLMTFNKDQPSQSLFEEDEDLLFPVEVGNEIYMKAFKVYSETKTLYEGLEKQLSKCIDKINKNEKVSSLSNNSKYNNNNNNNNPNNNSNINNNNNNNNNNNTSSSSSDEDDDKKSEVGQKRKSKGPTPLTSKTKRFKAPSQSESDRSEKEEKVFKESKLDIKDSNSNSNSNTASPIGKEINSNINNNGNSNGNNSNSSNGSNNVSGINKDVLSNGTLVAAREAKSNQWILAKVNGFNNKTQKYEVIDEDEEEQKKFSVPQKDIIPLPTLSNLPTFSVGTKVLAMFPDTTTFYIAIISQITKNKNKVTHYNLHFDDDQDSSGQTPNRRVSAQHVITYPKQT